MKRFLIILVALFALTSCVTDHSYHIDGGTVDGKWYRNPNAGLTLDTDAGHFLGVYDEHDEYRRVEVDAYTWDACEIGDTFNRGDHPDEGSCE